MRWVRSAAVAGLVLVAAGCGPAEYKKDTAPDNNVNQMLDGMKSPPSGGGPSGGSTNSGGGVPPGMSTAPPPVSVPPGGR